MIEHVRRRVLMAPSISEVHIATCDQEIEDVVVGYGGNVIRTANTHLNGTTRVAEAVAKLDCTHVLLVQGDEPLLLPDHLEIMIKAIVAAPSSDAWNATATLESADELDRHSFVKCLVSPSNKIITCFRRSPGFSNFEIQRSFIRKILGLIVYKKAFLIEISKREFTPFEQAEFIEQMRIIESGYVLSSVAVEPSLPSVNEIPEQYKILEYLEKNPIQQKLLQKVLEFSGT